MGMKPRKGFLGGWLGQAVGEKPGLLRDHDGEGGGNLMKGKEGCRPSAGGAEEEGERRVVSCGDLLCRICCMSKMFPDALASQPV
jgi:hypothetical protein